VRDRFVSVKLVQLFSNKDCAILLFIDCKSSISSLVWDWSHRSECGFRYA